MYGEMASAKDTATFFTHGTHTQYERVLALYPQAVKLKADRKAKRPEELVKLDNWYQNELPKKIKSRGKDAHLVHEELVQTMKWKQTRGKYYPQLSYLVKVNTPRAVMAETKKAFKKLPNLEQAITALSNLKGVGTTMASALLAAASPESAPFMADECLLAIPDIEGIDYTTKEYLKFASHIQSAAERLNKAAKESGRTNAVFWSPHKVEMALWTHYVVSDYKPELLSNEPLENGNSIIPAPIVIQNGDSLDAATTSEESNQGVSTTTATLTTTGGLTSMITNGKAPPAILDEDTNTSFVDRNGGGIGNIGGGSTSSPASLEAEETNDSIVSESTNDSNTNASSSNSTAAHNTVSTKTVGGEEEEAAAVNFENNKRPATDDDVDDNIDNVDVPSKKIRSDESLIVDAK